MAGIADIRFLTRSIQGYDVGGLVQFIPPELRAHTSAITTGIKAVADSMRISNPQDITKFGKEVIKAIRAGQIAPTVTAIGNFATAIAGSTLDIVPGGTQVKAAAKTAAKTGSKLTGLDLLSQKPYFKFTSNPYKKFNLKTKKKVSGKNTQTVVDPNVTVGKDASLAERLFYNPKARKYFIDKTGSVLHRTHASKGPYRTAYIVKNPKLKEKLDQPTGLNTQVRNSLQNKLEDNIINLEKQKLSIINNKNLKKINLNKWKKRIKKIDNKIALVKTDINNLGLDVQLINPSSGRLTQYGSNLPNLKKLADSISKDIKLETITYGGSNILPAGKKEGGLIGISRLTGPI